MEHKDYSLEDILNKLVGSTQPYGESYHDEEALKNLDNVNRVLEWATDRIYECRKSKK